MYLESPTTDRNSRLRSFVAIGNDATNPDIFSLTSLPQSIRNKKGLTEVKPLESFAVSLIELGAGKSQILGRRTRFRELQTLGCRCRVLSCNAC